MRPQLEGDFLKDISFSMNVCLKKTSSSHSMMNSVLASKYNDQASSDFIVKCQDQEFHVHQFILKERSDYFSGLLRNDCQESRNKKMIIDDFRPEVVEILLRYLYNGGVCDADFSKYDGKDQDQLIIDVMKLADKYNFTELFDAMDSHFAQNFLFSHHLTKNKCEELSNLRGILQIAEQTRAPKMSSLIFQWKSTGKNNIDDGEWSVLIRDHPNVAMTIANTAGRKDYQTWTREHSSWCFYGKEDWSIIVGPLGEMKGTVKCSNLSLL